MTIAEIAEKVIKIREDLDGILSAMLSDLEPGEEKTALLDRIKKAQASVPDWK